VNLVKIAAAAPFLAGTEMQKQHLFAVLDDELPRFKIILLKEVYSNGFQHTLTPYMPSSDENFELNWARARDTDTNLQKMRLSNGNLFLWRTPWTVFHKNVWLPILDSNDRARLPGQFMYTGSSNPSRILAQQQMRASMMSQLYGTLLSSAAPKPSAAPNPSSQSIPSFVVNIMKQDAIRNKAECPISMETITEATNISLTSCYHIFETGSLKNWLERSNACPVCKTPVAFTQSCKN